jgi:hypothetical protein
MDHTLSRGQSMKLPCVRFTVRRIAVTATICVAAFEGISSQVMSRGTDIRRGQAAVENVQVGNGTSRPMPCGPRQERCRRGERSTSRTIGPVTGPSRIIRDGAQTIESVEMAILMPAVTPFVETEAQMKARPGDASGVIGAQMKEFYGRWVGVSAPELGQAGRDQRGKLVTLSSLRGKRVLLFSFDAGVQPTRRHCLRTSAPSTGRSTLPVATRWR